MPDLLERLKSALADRYAIEREIGRGGMAVVYLAEDLKHGRQVAIKVLQPSLSATLGTGRFLREIETAARLNHPHILPLYDSGEADGFLYYVMPYVEGDSLRDRIDREGQLPVEESVRLTWEVAGGLGYAHKEGVVHRDIKPGNIMLSQGHAVIADFGIAQAVDEAGGEKLTSTGVSTGSPVYMSPEQARGSETLDGRTDIYSLGCVLYEMLAGEPPFTGGTRASITARKEMEATPSLRALRDTVPDGVERAVSKALAKVPADRFGSAEEFADALKDSRFDPVLPSVRVQPDTRRMSAAWRAVQKLGVPLALGLMGMTALFAWGLRPDRSETAVPQRQAEAVVETKLVVVLPFENLGPPEEMYFAAGMTDEITSRLAAVSGLGVISRKGALHYAGTDKSSLEIGEELGVGYILSGSVRWAGAGSGSSRVRITPELIRVADDTQLWSEAYDRLIEDIFEVQSDIAGQVIEQLGVTLLDGERVSLTARPTENLEAYTLYLKGRHFWNKRTEEDIQIGLTYFQQAVDLDPAYSLAHVGIADTWIFRGWYSVLAPKETFPKAKMAVTNSLMFDETLAEAHASLAHIHLEFDHDWETAEREYQRAIELNPRYPTAHHWYGGYLSAMGRHDEALRQAEKARELDPLSLIINTWVGLRHYFAGRYEVAIQEYERALELDPRFAPGHWHLGWALEQTGRYREAISEAQQAVDISGGNPLYIASLGHAYAIAGDSVRAREVLKRLERESATRHVSAYHKAVIYGALGETEDAFRWLDRAHEERSPWIGYMAVDPRLDGLRSDPRLDELLREVGLL